MAEPVVAMAELVVVVLVAATAEPVAVMVAVALVESAAVWAASVVSGAAVIVLVAFTIPFLVASAFHTIST